VTTLPEAAGVAEVAVELVVAAGELVSPVGAEPGVVVADEEPAAALLVVLSVVVVDDVTLEPGVALEPELLYAVLVAGVLWQPARAIAVTASAARIGDWRVMAFLRECS